MIQIYGTQRSSAGRCYLVLEEVGAPYQVAPLDMMGKKEHKTEAYLKLNPNGKVPCLVDGDFVIWESMAINQYLAEKYKPELLGHTPEDKGLISQWSLWALLELQPPMVDIIIQTMFMPEEKKDHDLIKKSQEKIPPALKILDRFMEGRDYILGDKISLADFNVASVVNISATINVPLGAYENVGPWMNRMRERPSFKKFLDMRTKN